MPAEHSTAAVSFEFGGFEFQVSRPHSFGLVIAGPADGTPVDYLHEVFLAAENREAFLDLIDNEGLVVCRNLDSTAPSYRRVRGKSSHGRLSQAEYYHHDGCSSPTKPRVVEIRLPIQEVHRNIHTAIAPFPEVVKAMLMALPERLRFDVDVARNLELFSGSADHYPPVETWDGIQGRVTRIVRREMDAESARSYFREVDTIADAYVLPWNMSESRLMVNNRADLSMTMQHRRAYQKPRATNERNGSLVKRWTAEEA